MPSLLIVSAYFPPSRKIGARRPERFARHLAKLGWDVTVLTLRPGYGGPADDGFTPPEGVEVLRTHAILPGNLLRRAASAWHRRRSRRRTASVGEAGDPGRTEASGSRRGGILRRVRDAGWRGVANLEFPDRWIGWFPFALAAVRGRRFDVVLATLPPYTPALLARRIARTGGSILALDYRDPWTEAPRVDWDPALYSHLLDRHRRTEDACLRDTDVVIGASPGICGWLAPRAGLAPLFAPNSFDVREDTPAVRSTVLVYTGSLAYGRTLEPVLAAMARLGDDPAGKELELVYAGTGGERLRDQAARLGVAGRVRDLGYLPAREADALTKGALAAVVLVTPRYEYMIPGKLFDVVASGTPLLLIAPEDADVTTICREHRLGWDHAPGDVEGIEASLRRALRGEIPNPVELERLRTDRVVSTVDRALRAAIERGPRIATGSRQP